MKARLKASDVFNRTNYMFSEKSGFEKAFPTIKSIKIIVEDEYYNSNQKDNTRIYGRDCGEFINCNNPSCFNGGFNVGHMIRDMLINKERNKDFTATCQGYEGSPKGRIKYRECINYFKVNIQLEYKNYDDPPQDSNV